MSTIIHPSSSEIKNAIKILIRRGADKDNLQIINDALSNSELDEQFWQDLFDSQGATDAIEQKFYSPEMVRLLTLRAMILPETLLVFANWLKIKDITDLCYEVSSNFQSGIRANFSVTPFLEKCILDQIFTLIPDLIYYPSNLNFTAWLLKDENGCWAECYRKNLRPDIDKRIDKRIKDRDKIISDNILENLIRSLWIGILNDITDKLDIQKQPTIPDYYIFAQLFEKLGDYEIAAVFYYVSYGKIPKSIFKKLSPNDVYAEIEVYQIKVKCKLTFIDFTFLLLGTIVYFIFQILKFAWFCAVFVFGAFFALGLLGLAIQNWPIVLFILFILGSCS
jgi:hypothetical protein